MTNSIVNGGYWCSAPRGLAEALGRTNREERSGTVELIVASDGGREAVGEQEVRVRLWDAAENGLVLLINQVLTIFHFFSTS